MYEYGMMSRRYPRQVLVGVRLAEVNTWHLRNGRSITDIGVKGPIQP
jgi:hypothetical protein